MPYKNSNANISDAKSEEKLEQTAREVGESMKKLNGLGKRRDAWILYHIQQEEIQRRVRINYPLDFRSAQFSGI